MREFTPVIVWKDPNEITPYIKNAKLHPTEQIDKIAGQLAAVGWTQPIVVDKDYVIIAGHGRREAALRLMMKQVPVVIADHLDEYEVMAARMADNKVAEAPWDHSLLKFDFGTLKMHNVDLKLTGFDLGEIEVIENSWGSDIETISNIDENSDASMGTIKIHCAHEQKSELTRLLQTTIDESGFEGVELE